MLLSAAGLVVGWNLVEFSDVRGVGNLQSSAAAAADAQVLGGRKEMERPQTCEKIPAMGFSLRGYPACTMESFRNRWLSNALSAVLLLSSLVGCAPADSITDSVCDSTMVVGTPADLEAIEHCESLYGSLRVEDQPWLTRLDLDRLERIERYLVISRNTALTDVSLPALETVGVDLWVEDNPSLAGFSVHALTDVGIQYHEMSETDTTLRVAGNQSLATLEGLDSLEDVIADFEIVDNDALSSLDGLQSLRTVDREMLIEHNDSLVSLEGMPNVERIGELIIRDNDSLTNLHGCPAPETLSLDVGANDALTSLDGIPQHSRLEYLGVRDNVSLRSLTALDSFESIGRLSLCRCDLVSDLQGLGALSTVRSLFIEENAILSSLEELSSLEQVEDSLYILSNDCLSQTVAETFANSYSPGWSSTVEGNGASYPCE